MSTYVGSLALWLIHGGLSLSSGAGVLLALVAWWVVLSGGPIYLACCFSLRGGMVRPMGSTVLEVDASSFGSQCIWHWLFGFLALWEQARSSIRKRCSDILKPSFFWSNA